MDKNTLINNELDWKCSILKDLLQNEEACKRYERESRLLNKYNFNPFGNVNPNDATSIRR